MTLYSYLRNLLFKLEPENAHTVVLTALDIAHGFGILKLALNQTPRIPCKVMGLDFLNPVGCAAGLDKNANHINALGELGFGFIEVGTVTPLPQRGNAKPRVFRVVDHHALINRLGFNNVGLEFFINHLQRRTYSGILGINIGKNAATPLEHAAIDYCQGINACYPYADYFTVNISSPNTEGLRQLQQNEYLKILLAALKESQQQCQQQYKRYVPLVIKVAPDLNDDDIILMARLFTEFNIDGVIATNTTVSRQDIAGSQYADEKGGLSGAPLKSLSTEILRKFRQALPSEMALIASGGIMNGADVKEKIAAGAQLVQLYTGFIYQGPKLIRECLQEWQNYHDDGKDK